MFSRDGVVAWSSAFSAYLEAEGDDLVSWFEASDAAAYLDDLTGKITNCIFRHGKELLHQQLKSEGDRSMLSLKEFLSLI
jgi:hypothetical protein